MRFSPILTELGVYPFSALDAAKSRAESKGVELIDFGIGDPREGAEPFIRDALVNALEDVAGYPRAAGLPELRQAIAEWLSRRFAVDIDPEREIVPTLGAKEAIFSFAQIVVDLPGGNDTVIVTEPGYPVAARGARVAGARVVQLPLQRDRGHLPDLNAVSAKTWQRTALLWLNYPNNPTGACAPPSLYAEALDLAEQHDFLVASDEAYSELFFGEPPASGLQAPVRQRLVAFNSLSKRSSMTGYRTGFVACDPTVADALRLYRPTVGTAPQEFVQRAAVTAWRDEGHVERARARYRRKRELLLDVLRGRGFQHAGGSASMFLWMAPPDREPADQVALRLLESGIVVTPGGALGPSGEGFVRFALVPTEAECARAAAILEEVA